MRRPETFASAIGAGLLMATAALGDPYNPGERALGGGFLGAGTGGCHRRNRRRRARRGIGAAVGGGLGAVAGAASTPARPRSAYRRHHHYVHHRYY